MQNFLHDLIHREREDVVQEIPGVLIVYNHRLKVALLYHGDPGMPSNLYADLEKHLHKRGYILQVIVASATGGERQ